jgi:hypothetical protein
VSERLEEHPFLGDEEAVVEDGIPLHAAQHAPG